MRTLKHYHQSTLSLRFFLCDGLELFFVVKRTRLFSCYFCRRRSWQLEKIRNIFSSLSSPGTVPSQQKLILSISSAGPWSGPCKHYSPRLLGSEVKELWLVVDDV